MRRLALALALFAPLEALADDDMAPGLAELIAAEAFCGLHYDQAAVAAFVEANVAGDDLDFTARLRGLVFIAERNQAGMSRSAATAHCTQIRRLAIRHGFVAP